MEMMERVLQSAQDMPPEVRSIFEQMQGGMGGAAAMGIGFVFSLFFSLFFYSIFGLLGGLLGALMFRKDAPPPPPPPSPGFTPPTFNPPPPLPPPHEGS
jgi:predicted lipid-binding transport protein (Tim44 family)